MERVHHQLCFHDFQQAYDFEVVTNSTNQTKISEKLFIFWKKSKLRDFFYDHLN